MPASSSSFASCASRAASLDQQLLALLECTPLTQLSPRDLCDLWYLRWLCLLLKKKALAQSARARLPQYRDLVPAQTIRTTPGALA